MKTTKTNFLINTVYAYINLVYKIFPLIILLLFSPFVILYFTLGHTDVSTLDVFDLFTVNGKSPKAFSYTLTLGLAAGIISMLIFVFIYLILRKLNLFIKDVNNGETFSVENGKRLKFVGMVLAIIAAIKHLCKIVFVSFLIPNPSFTGRPLIFIIGMFSLAYNVFLIAGLFVMVIGQVIIQGAEIKEENDLTV